MALFDVSLLFFHTTTAYGFTTGEFMPIAVAGGGTNACSGLVVNLGNARDMGIGDGEFIPHVFVAVGSTGITSSCTSLQVNLQFQGSTDSTTWSTYMESGYAATSSYLPNTVVFNQPLPRRPAGLALPQYYRVNVAVNAAGVTGTAFIASVGLSSSSLLGGIMIQSPNSAGTLDQYAAGFTVA